MKQYIPKVDIVTELKMRIKINKECMLGLRNLDYYQGKVDALNDTISFLDTLEVKEVDLEKEIKNEIDEYWYDNDYGAIQRHGGTITMKVSDVKEIAKHFFELGLFSLLTWKDVKLISEIGNDFMNSEESDDLSEEEYYKEILRRFKMQKGE